MHTPASLKWTAAQEKNLSRDYPFQDHRDDPADPALFVQHAYYLHFLWLPHVRPAINVLSGWLECMEQCDSDPGPSLFAQAHSWTIHPSPPVEVPRPFGTNATRHTQHYIFSSSSPPAAFRAMGYGSVPTTSLLPSGSTTASSLGCHPLGTAQGLFCPFPSCTCKLSHPMMRLTMSCRLLQIRHHQAAMNHILIALECAHATLFVATSQAIARTPTSVQCPV